jgi:hypothetical protein
MSQSTPLNQLRNKQQMSPPQMGQQQMPPQQMGQQQMGQQQMPPQQMPPQQMPPQQMGQQQMPPQQMGQQQMGQQQMGQQQMGQQQMGQQQMEQQQNGDNLVNSILNDMDDPIDQTNGGDMNSDAYNYLMDESQVPPEMQNVQFSDENEILEYQTDEPPNMINSKREDSTPVCSRMGILSKLVLPDTIVGKLLNHLKNPVLVFGLLFLLSLPQVNRMIFNAVPTMLLESGQVSLTGVLLKAVIGTVLFVILSYFL